MRALAAAAGLATNISQRLVFSIARLDSGRLGGQLAEDIPEAALLDGASRWRAFHEIVLPLAWPGIATTGLLTFLYSWNEFLFALSFTLGPERYTVPVAIALFRGQYQVPWGQVFAASIVATAPLAVLILVAQRRIVQGLTAGGVKG